MKTKVNKYKTKICLNNLYEGQSIEEKMRRVVATNEPIESVAPMIYTEQKQGVIAEYDVRTDKWDIAAAAMDKVSKSNAAKGLEIEQQQQEQQQQEQETE